MIGHNLPECTSTYVLTASSEHISMSAHTLEFLLCGIKHVSYIFILAVSHNFLSDSACSLLIDPIFLLSQCSFLALCALCSVAPSWKDYLSLISSFDVFEKVFPCDVTQKPRKWNSSSIFIKRGTKSEDIGVHLHAFHPIKSPQHSDYSLFWKYP